MAFINLGIFKTLLPLSFTPHNLDGVSNPWPKCQPRRSKWQQQKRPRLCTRGTANQTKQLILLNNTAFPVCQIVQSCSKVRASTIFRTCAVAYLDMLWESLSKLCVSAIRIAMIEKAEDPRKGQVSQKIVCYAKIFRGYIIPTWERVKEYL